MGPLFTNVTYQEIWACEVKTQIMDYNVLKGNKHQLHIQVGAFQPSPGGYDLLHSCVDQSKLLYSRKI